MAEAGVLVAEVRAVKDMGSRHFVLVDAGFNDLMRPAMYGSYHHISLLPADGRDTRGTAARNGDRRATVRIRRRVHPAGGRRRGNPRTAAGPDRRLSGVPRHRRLRRIDVLNYNSRPLLPEVLFENGEPRLIRRRQTIEELIALEII